MRMQGSQRPSIQSWFLRLYPLTKRSIAVGIVVCIFLVYFGPSAIKATATYFLKDSSLDKCMETHLMRHKLAVENYDAYIIRDLHPENNPKLLPFVGNGKLASLFGHSSSLYLLYQHAVSKKDEARSILRDELKSFQLPYKPIFRLVPRFAPVTDSVMASVVNFREGIVENLQCLKVEGFYSPVFVNHTVIAHRSRPNIFLQHIEASFEKPEKQQTLTLDLKVDAGSDNWKTEKNRPESYTTITNTFEVSQGEFMAISMSTRISDYVVEIGTNHRGHVDSLTVVAHSAIKSNKLLGHKEESRIQGRVVVEATSVKDIAADQLLREHKAAWKDILHTGLTLTNSEDDPGLPSSLSINETLYYVLSTSDSKLHDEGIPEAERRNLIQRLQTPDFCYHGNPTFHGQSLWTPATSVQDVIQLQKRWSLTLIKNQCKSLVTEGAEGLLQAILLSFGGLRFTESDLRLNMDPMVLHNDIFFHRIIYRNDTVDIRIKHSVGKETPVILVSLHSPPKIPLYACEAGCVHEAVQLGVGPKELPVFVTDPVTAILYISHDKGHLKDLRDTIHVKTRVDHAQHMEEVRKGTGLPTIFWVGIGSLIIFFHLFLIKLIWNEYKSSYSSKSYPVGGSRIRLGPRGRLIS